MNHRQEQEYELEALSAIYYNEIHVISKEEPISFTIKVRPSASNYEEPDANYSDDERDDNSDDDDDDDDSFDDNEDLDDESDEGGQQSDSEESATPQRDLYVELLFTLPSMYPEEKPSIQILESDNLLPHELSELMDVLSQKTEECFGTVMVFMLVCDVVEWLAIRSEREANEIEQEKERKEREVEAEYTKKIIGTPVTVQSFLAWKAKFDAEMLKAKLEVQKQQSDQNSAGTKRLTGREMFESGSALVESDLDFVDDLDQNQIEALLHNIDEEDLGQDSFSE